MHATTLKEYSTTIRLTGMNPPRTVLAVSIRNPVLGEQLAPVGSERQ